MAHCPEGIAKIGLSGSRDVVDNGQKIRSIDASQKAMDGDQKTKDGDRKPKGGDGKAQKSDLEVSKILTRTNERHLPDNEDFNAVYSSKIVTSWLQSTPTIKKTYISNKCQ